MTSRVVVCLARFPGAYPAGPHRVPEDCAQPLPGDPPLVREIDLVVEGEPLSSCLLLLPPRMVVDVNLMLGTVPIAVIVATTDHVTV